MALQTATLTRMTADRTPKEEPGATPIPVQFNPSTLHLSYSNANSGGQSQGRQQAQAAGTNSAVLTVELQFDSADEGTTGAPVSVRTKTLPVEALVLPIKPRGGGQQKSAPPRVRFQWGDLTVIGFVSQMNIDFDLFADSGVPLHAKIGFSITQQDPTLENEEAGPGADRGSATAPGKAGAGALGGVGLGASASLGLSAGVGLQAGLSAGLGLGASLSAGVSVGSQTALAIGGESAAEFAARVGIDPAAWRAIAVGQLDGTLSLDAGAQLDFEPGLSASAGLGTTVGVESSLRPPLEAAFGLEASPRLDPSAALTAPGFALSAGGGLAASLQTVDIVRTAAAATATRAAFAAPPPPPPPSPASGVPAGVSVPVARDLASLPRATAEAATRAPAGPSSPPRPDRPEQPRTPLLLTGLPTPAHAEASPPAPRPPAADPRATSYGYGVPLRPQVGNAAEERLGAVRGVIPLHPRARGAAAPVSDDPTLAPWISLPPARATPAPVVGSDACRCGGRGGCGCGGARGGR